MENTIAAVQLSPAEYLQRLQELKLSREEMAETELEVYKVNEEVKKQKGYKKVLGEEDFLRLLTEELKHQDPTEPMKDRDFIAQMVQFSSLKMIDGMSKELNKVYSEIEAVSKLITRGQAYSLLGKVVEIQEGNTIIGGVVDEIRGGDFPQLLVNGKYFDFQSVIRVKKK